MLLATETNVSDILATLSEEKPPAIAVIDSIQTMWAPSIEVDDTLSIAKRMM